MKFSTRIIATAALTLVSGLTFAQSSGSLNLSGTVASNCTITVSALPKATALDLVAGETDAHVANVTENCNDPRGYTVTVTSDNAGNLVPGFSGGANTEYSLTYDNAEGTIVDKLLATRDGAQFNNVVPVTLSLAANAQALAGTYRDVVQFVIAAR